MLYRSFHNLLFPANLKREGEVIPMNHVENKKKLNNKGFSLVELIIVIAIMAVLIGVLAPQYLKYVEKSRESADLDNYQAIISAIEIYNSDPSNESVTGTITFTAVNTAPTTSDAKINTALKTNGIDLDKVKMKSKDYCNGVITIAVDGLTVSGGTGSKLLADALGKSATPAAPAPAP